MNARAMNAKTWALAAALSATLMMGSAPATEASPRRYALDKSPAVRMVAPEAAMRTLMCYGEGPWMAPAAVILKSEHDWTEWNDAMLAAGRSVSSVKAPAGVDWSKEAVMVVTLGESQQNATLTLKSAHRVGLRTEVEMDLAWGSGGTSPCHVVAMDKRLLKNVRLQNSEAAGLASQVQVYVPNAAVAKADAQAAPMTAAVATTWGEVKDAYRQ